MKQVDCRRYGYDLENQSRKKLFAYEPNCDIEPVLAAHVLAVCGAEDVCRVWAIDITDEVVTELDTGTGNVMVFSTEYECDGYFKGLLTEPFGSVEECFLSKEDFYRSNYDGAFR